MISLPPKGNEAKKFGSNFAPLRVEAQTSPNMTVKVAEGAFWTADNEFMEYIGGTSPNVSAPTSDAKWVLVTVKNTGVLNIINGASSGTPVLPDPSQYKDELPLAAIFIGDTTTAITSDMIFDLRPLWSIPPDSVSQSQLNDFATITYVDNGLNTKAGTANTQSPNFTLNFGGANINDSGFYIERFSGSDVGIRFNESASIGSPPVSTPAWEFTNDGVTWNPIGVSAGSYYTKPDLDGGALDSRYFTQNDFNVTGVLDSRYYEKTVADTTFAVLTHTHTVGDISGLGNPVETINNLTPSAGNIQLGLNELDDVTTALPTDSHVLTYNTTFGEYRNRPLNTDDLSDVDTTASLPVSGDVLVHTGAGFVNRPLLKSDIADFVDTEYVLTAGTDQDVNGVKTFKNGIVVETSLVVTGSNTSIQTTELKVTDPYIDLNWGETGAGVGNGTGVAGIRIDRGAGGSPNKPDAIIQWDESAEQWEFGVEGNANPVLTGSHTHVSVQIVDFAARVTSELNLNNSLMEISDVNYLTTPTTGEYLRFGVSDWENKDFGADITSELNVNNLDQLQDVTYLGSPALAGGNFLRWNGAAWENHTAIKADVSDFVETDYIHTNSTPEIKAGDLTINGDFTVGGGVGTITSINSEALNVADSVITLNAGELAAGVAGGTGSAGIQIDRGTLQNAQLWWSEPAGTWLAHFSSGGSLVVGQLSFNNHNHIVADISDLSSTAIELNTLTGINTSITAQQQFDAKLKRTGDVMTAGGNLTFVGGEILGLPATPTVDGSATSKLYVTNLLTDKINRIGDSMDPGASLAFSGGGQLTGLPALPIATAATSKEYVDAHINDLALHINNVQNIFLDGLTLTGGSALTAAHVNELIGITGNVQTLLNNKTDKIIPATVNNFAGLNATGNLIDSGLILNDAGTTALELWSANKIDSVKTDKIIPATVNNFAGLNATGNLIDSGLILNDAGTTALELWSANKIDSVKMDKMPSAAVGNFGEFDAAGNLIDGGINSAAFASVGHTHIVANITDFPAGVTSELSNNSINLLSDVNSASASIGDFLRWNGTTWLSSASSSIAGFVYSTGGVIESIDGAKTFADNGFFQQNLTVTQDLTVSGNIAIAGDMTVSGDHIIQGQEIVATNNITLNYGSSSPVSANGGGLLLQRDVTLGSPPVQNAPDAAITWDHGNLRWEAGLDNALQPVALENVTPAQPFYELVVGSGNAVYALGFAVPVPVSGKTGIQIFVNGIKQIESALKAFTINYNTSTVTFNAGSEPVLGDDVEFYGFGMIG